jgi:copper resistance protein B
MSRRTAAVLVRLLPLVVPAAVDAQALSGNVDLFEYHLGGDRRLLFDGSLIYGGETDAVVAKLVTDGAGRKIEQIQGELVYSRAIGRGFNLEAGARHEFGSQPHVSYAVLGLSGEPRRGLALESYGVVSQRGDIFGEFKAVYDHQLFDRLTVQPRFAFNLAAQDVPDQGIAAGLVGVEAGLRVRYEMTSPFAPYIGISHQRLLGRTVRIARRDGGEPRSTHIVIGFSSAF